MARAGTQVTCFTSTKVQILTQVARAAFPSAGLRERDDDVSGVEE